jgi:hypothetical protein
MITALDTNVIVALWAADSTLSHAAQKALDTAQARGRLVVSAPVFAELMAAPRHDESFLDGFFRSTGIAVEWNLEEPVWRIAGHAFQSYADRRRRQRDHGARRILADFLIGAHATHRGYHLLTLDDRIYSASFPDLALVTM